jgi:hypothetical protein
MRKGFAKGLKPLSGNEVLERQISYRRRAMCLIGPRVSEMLNPKGCKAIEDLFQNDLNNSEFQKTLNKERKLAELINA